MMLILSRKTNESLVIGNNIWVTVLAVNRGKVRLGVEGPREVPVHRKEVYESILAHGQKTLKSWTASSCEQEARNLLEACGDTKAQERTGADVAALANYIAAFRHLLVQAQEGDCV
jgi:carbon storage regulator